MKKKLVLLLVVVGSVMAVSAEGRNNKSTERGERMEQLLKDAEILTITGKLELVNGEEATVVSKGTTYTIKAPWQELVNLELKDGQTVTFKGIEMQPKMQWDDSEKYLMVTVVIIDDKEITIERSMGRDSRGSKSNNKKGK